MSDLAKLTDAIVHEYLKTKDKNLAKVFEQKMNAVRNLPAHLVLFFVAHIRICICIASVDGVGKNLTYLTDL